jgi:hypothetical protein
MRPLKPAVMCIIDMKQVPITFLAFLSLNVFAGEHISVLGIPSINSVGITTYYEITPNSISGLIFHYGVNIVILLIGIGLLKLRRSNKGLPITKRYAPVIVIGIALLFFFLGHIDNLGKEQMLKAYRNNKCQITEGLVHVRYEQLETGHTPGDKIEIGGHEFDIDYYLVTPGYKQTIAHGGVLREGVYARLHHYDGVILKVETKNMDKGQPINSADPKGR